MDDNVYITLSPNLVKSRILLAEAKKVLMKYKQVKARNKSRLRNLRSLESYSPMLK